MIVVSEQALKRWEEDMHAYVCIVHLCVNRFSHASLLFCDLLSLLSLLLQFSGLTIQELSILTHISKSGPPSPKSFSGPPSSKS
jgi:hypothetical protein